MENKPYKNEIEELAIKKKIEKLENELLQDPYFLMVKDMSIQQIMDQMKEAYMATTGQEMSSTKLLADAFGIHEEMKRLKKKQEAAKIGRSII